MIKENQLIILLIDGNALIHRSFHGIPPLKTKDGTLVNAVYGFANTILMAIKLFHPEYLAVAFDVGRITFRNKQYKEYKAHREKMADELAGQLPLVHEVCKALNFPEFGVKNYEADDVIGTITNKLQSLPRRETKVSSTGANKLQAIIVTGDMDTLQLVNENTNVYSVSRGIKKAELFDQKKVEEKYGFPAKYLVDYKGLRGDPSDNIPGVPGVGEKTAINLIKQFGTIDNLYKHLLCHPELGSGSKRSRNEFGMTEKIKKLLIDNKRKAFLSKDLATIKQDVSLDFRLEDAKVHDYDKNKVIKLFDQLEFKSLIKKLPEAKNPIKQDKLF